jgi:hypothetical protein
MPMLFTLNLTWSDGCDVSVVLDRRDNSGADTGRFELAYHDSTNPNTRGSDTRLLLEGQRIKKPDLQRYASIDQRAMKVQKDREARVATEKQNKMPRIKKAGEEIAKPEDNMTAVDFADRPASSDASSSYSSRSRAKTDLSLAESFRNEDDEECEFNGTSSTADDFRGGEADNAASRVDKSGKILTSLRKSTIDIYSGRDQRGVSGLVVRSKPPAVPVSKTANVKR